jgi:hypothetical protein
MRRNKCVRQAGTASFLAQLPPIWLSLEMSSTYLQNPDDGFLVQREFSSANGISLTKFGTSELA